MCQYCEEPIDKRTPQNAYTWDCGTGFAYIRDVSGDPYYSLKDGESKWAICSDGDYLYAAAILFCPFCGRELPQD